MAPVIKNQAVVQLNNFVLWEHIFSLIPHNDTKLRQQVSDMITKTYQFANDPPVPDKDFTVTDVNGNKVTVDGDDLLMGTDTTLKMIPVDEPEYQKFFQSELNLLNQIEQKYHGPEHQNLMQEVGIVKNKVQNLKDGLGLEASPGHFLVSGNFGITKFQDVLYDLEPAEKGKSKDRMQWKGKDPAVIEQSMKDLGVADIQRKFMELDQHNAEWAKEWYRGERDPQKLHAIAEKFKKDCSDLDGYIKNFEEKYNADMKRPEGQRKIYNITNRDDIGSQDLITDGKNPTHRGINGKNWEDCKQEFHEQLEHQLITAELTALSKKKTFGFELQPLVRGYLALTDINLVTNTREPYKGKAFRTPAITGIRRLMDLKAAAEKNPEAKGAKELIELADKHLNDPANAELVEKANKLNEKRVETLNQLNVLSQDSRNDGIRNGKRLEHIYNERQLGGDGTLRYYAGTVGIMQYFNKESDEQVLQSMRTVMDIPEKCSPEQKKKMARELEKCFKTIMEFDNKKCEYKSYEELWTDPKHKDLHIMTSIAMEAEQLVKQYQKLQEYPEAKCALNEKALKEVKSKIGLLEMEAQIVGSMGTLPAIYSDPGMADYSLPAVMAQDAETIMNVVNKTHDLGLSHVVTLADSAKKGIKPQESYLNAVNKERAELGFPPFKDEETLNKRYDSIVAAIDKAVELDKQEELEKNQPKEPEVKEPEVKPKKKAHEWDVSGVLEDALHSEDIGDILSQKKKDALIREHQELKDAIEDGAENEWEDLTPEIEAEKKLDAIRKAEKEERINKTLPAIKAQELQNSYKRGDFLESVAEFEKGLNARHRFDVGRVFSGDSKEMQALKKSIANYKEYMKNPLAPKFKNVSEMDLLDEMKIAAEDYRKAKTYDPKTGEPIDIKKKSQMGRERLNACKNLIIMVDSRRNVVADYHDPEKKPAPEPLGEALKMDIKALEHGSNRGQARKEAMKQVIVRKALADEYGKNAIVGDDAYLDKYKEFAENGVFDKVDALQGEQINEMRANPMKFYKSLGLDIGVAHDRIREFDATANRPTLDKADDYLKAAKEEPMRKVDIPEQEKVVQQVTYAVENDDDFEIEGGMVTEHRLVDKEPELSFEEQKAAFAEKAAETILHGYYQKAMQEVMNSDKMTQEQKEKELAQNPEDKYIEANKESYLKDQDFQNFMNSIKTPETLSQMQAKSGNELFDFYRSGVYLQQPEKKQEAPAKQQKAQPVNVDAVREEAQAKLNASFDEKKQYPDKNAAAQEYAVITTAIPIKSQQKQGKLPGITRDDFDVQVNALKKTETFKTMIKSGSNRELFEKATRDKGQDLYAELGRARSKTISQKKQQKENAEKIKVMEHKPKKEGPNLG